MSKQLEQMKIRLSAVAHGVQIAVGDAFNLDNFAFCVGVLMMPRFIALVNNLYALIGLSLSMDLMKILWVNRSS